MTPKPAMRPRTDADELGAALARRHAPTPDTETETDAPPPAAAGGGRETKRRGKRVSWYVPEDLAARFAAVVDDLHWGTRQPKLAVVGALLEAALNHTDEARTALEARKDDA